MNPWTYKQNIIDSIDKIPPNSIGFIYILTYKKTGQKYIGRKLLYQSKIKTINKKRKKIKVESDWLSYHSSSPSIKDIINIESPKVFNREILLFCQSKGELLYAEECMLYHYNALLTDKFLNDNIRSKVYRNWVKREEFQHDIINLKDILGSR